FDANLNLKYPDDSTVQIWTQGRGMIYSRNTIKEFPNDVSKNPPYLEIELLSPLQEIQPQEKINFSYRIAVSTIPKGESVHTVDQDKITVSPLTAFEQDGYLNVEASYGFFEEKRIYLNVTDKAENKLLCEQEFHVSPLLPLKIRQSIKIENGDAEQVLIELKSIDENRTNIIDQIEICTNSLVK